MEVTRVSTDMIYPVVEKSMKTNTSKFRGVVQKYIDDISAVFMSLFKTKYLIVIIMAIVNSSLAALGLKFIFQ